MISQLLSQTKTPSMLDLGGAQPAKGAEAGPQGAFALVLSMLGGAVQGKQSAEGADEATGKTAVEGDEVATIPGDLLPTVAGTGKILPDAAEALPETPDAAAPADAAPAETATAMLALVAPQMAQTDAAVPTVSEGKSPAAAPQLPAGLPLPAQQLASDAAAPAKGEGAKSAAQPAVAIQVAPLSASSEGNVQRDPALPTEKPQTDLATRLQPNTASADRQPQRDLAGGERPADAAVKVASKAPAEAAPTQPAMPTPAPATPIAAAPAAPAAEAAPSVAADKPIIETGIARELSRIVDSLASAREAMAAKGATLALDHAEFGELSLRFDQRRDGQLAVQLAAADPDAHRAVAAAVADRPAFAQPDGSQHNAQTGGNASARGSLADRDGGSAEGNAPRHERQDERRRDDAGTNHTSGNGARGDSSAIYA